MQRDEARQIISAQFYQSLAENDIEVTAIPHKQLQGIVNALADSMFAFVDAIDETDNVPLRTTPSNEATSTLDNPLPEHVDEAAAEHQMKEHVEKLLWKGRPFLTLGLRYELTNERLRIISGILSKQVEEVELVRVHDSEVKQHIGERLFNIGDIHVYSDDPSTPEFALTDIEDPIAVRELLRNAMINEKERRGFEYQEEM